jgi:hypothetical protein
MRMDPSCATGPCVHPLSRLGHNSNSGIIYIYREREREREHQQRIYCYLQSHGYAILSVSHMYSIVCTKCISLVSSLKITLLAVLHQFYSLISFIFTLFLDNLVVGCLVEKRECAFITLFKTYGNN